MRRALALAALALAAAPGGFARALPSADPGFRVDTAVSGLGAVTDVAFIPDGRMLVTEKNGLLKIVERSVPKIAGRFAVDETSEKGLLGVLVDPEFARTRRVFLYLSASDEAGGTDLDRNRVLSVTLGQDGRVEPGSEKVLVRGLRGPANHDGGGLAIGPDGFLYVGVGDSGCNSGRAPEPVREPTNYFATCLDNGNGKILRVGLDGSIPADNPLIGVARATACGATCREPVLSRPLAPPRRDLWAWGLRNPWRFAFDPVTGLLWVGDVGEVTWEELTIVEKGRHHGWPWREGRHGWPRARCREVTPNTGDCVDPVYECDRDEHAHEGADIGCRSITGGEFLAAPRWPDPLRRRYVFGDNVTRQLWSIELTRDRRGVVKGSRRDLAKAPGLPVSFRRGPDGDVYVAILPGAVLRISPARPHPSP
ncbi:MAG TPA: PQQ-dependent sugar dehydrogenase [Anaeromyxobacter sp.]